MPIMDQGKEHIGRCITNIVTPLFFFSSAQSSNLVFHTVLEVMQTQQCSVCNIFSHRIWFDGYDEGLLSQTHEQHMVISGLQAAVVASDAQAGMHAENNLSDSSR